MTHAIQNALQKAIDYAKTYQLTNIEVEAVLKAVLEEPDSLFKSVLERANINIEELERALDNKLKSYPTMKGDQVQYGQYISP